MLLRLTKECAFESRPLTILDVSFNRTQEATSP
jgi:hypothetical protein